MSPTAVSLEQIRWGREPPVADGALICPLVEGFRKGLVMVGAFLANLPLAPEEEAGDLAIVAEVCEQTVGLCLAGVGVCLFSKVESCAKW